MNKNKLKSLFKTDNKKLKTDIMAAFALGILLLLLGGSFFNSKVPKETPVKAAAQTNNESNLSVNTEQKNLERRLEVIFSSVEGAGEIKVMVTTVNGNELVVAQENKNDQSTTTESGQQGDQRTIESNNSEGKYVLLENADGSNSPLVLKQLEPKVEGVVIVAQGGDDILVKDALSKAAQALLNVPAHKVEILKMK